MSDAELDRVEQRYGFEFADDHRAFLSLGLPASSRSRPDWRNGAPEALREKLRWPADGALSTWNTTPTGTTNGRSRQVSWTQENEVPRSRSTGLYQWEDLHFPGHR